MSFHRFTTVLLIGVVLINVIGPILDHHFVERGHNHDHLYLSVTAADHSHVYDSKHSHKSHVSNVSRTLSDSDDNIVFLTKDNGMQIFTKGTDLATKGTDLVTKGTDLATKGMDLATKGMDLVIKN